MATTICQRGGICISHQKMLFALSLAFICLFSGVQSSIELSGQSIKDALAEFTLLDMMNNNEQHQGVEFEIGNDGFPTYKFLPTTNVKSFYGVILPQELAEFAILINYRLNSVNGGYLFSVVSSHDTVVQLGVHLSTVSKATNSYNATLVYSQTDQHAPGRKLASFQVPYVPKKWNSIGFQVLNDRVSFYYDCELRNTTIVLKEPEKLVFHSASTLYIGQAGPNLPGHFEVSTGGCQFASLIIINYYSIIIQIM